MHLRIAPGAPPVPIERLTADGEIPVPHPRAAMKKGTDVSVSAQAWDTAAQVGDTELVGQPVVRSISRTARKLFLIWTIAWWGGVGVCAALFFLGVLDFVSSAKSSLYGISIWLNGWLLAFVAQRHESRSKLDLYHDCLVIWMLSYAMTNLLWEIPWVIFSPFIFNDLNTIDDVLAQTDTMRSSIFHTGGLATMPFDRGGGRVVSQLREGSREDFRATMKRLGGEGG